MTPETRYTHIIYPQAHEWLGGRGAIETSQFGEDGLIAACLERFGETNRFCFEVGAHDGLGFSNTKALRDKGWTSVLIERDLKAFSHLSKLANERTHCVCADVLEKQLDCILRDYNAPEAPDLGVIDIDGQDYWLWHDMWLHKPRLMLVEIQPNSEDREVERGTTEKCAQAGLNPIVRLGEKKGYVALAHTVCNVLFCRKELL